MDRSPVLSQICSCSPPLEKTRIRGADVFSVSFTAPIPIFIAELDYLRGSPYFSPPSNEAIENSKCRKHRKHRDIAVGS